MGRERRFTSPAIALTLFRASRELRSPKGGRHTHLDEIRLVAHQIAAEMLSMKRFAEPLDIGTTALHQCFDEVTNDSRPPLPGNPLKISISPGKASSLPHGRWVFGAATSTWQNQSVFRENLPFIISSLRPCIRSRRSQSNLLGSMTKLSSLSVSTPCGIPISTKYRVSHGGGASRNLSLETDHHQKLIIDYVM
jgi:hypothetical protein